MTLLLEDVRNGFRTWRKSPAFVGMSILTMALGIGGLTAVYSVVRGVLWLPLPYANYERLVHIFEARPRMRPDQGVQVSIPTLEDWKRESRLIEDFARIPSGPSNDFVLQGSEAPQEVLVNRMSADLMRLIRTEPVVGRRFEESDEVPGRDRLILLSHRFWQRHFGGAEDVVGETIHFTRGPYTIVGVMPRGFEYPPTVGTFVPTDVAGWIPAPTEPASVSDRSDQSQQVIGLLKPGVTEAQAIAELDAITQRSAEIHPEKQGWGVRLIGIQGRVDKYSRHKNLLLTLLTAVGFVLLIGCANIAGLSLTRARSRRREFAVRAALGASRLRITCQLLVESLTIALTGGALGVLAAVIGFESFKRWLPGGLPRTELIQIDSGVLGFVAGATVLVALGVGILPALKSSSPNLSSSFGRTSSTGIPARLWSGKALVVLEVAMSTVLCVAAGLTVKGIVDVRSQDTGLALEQLLTARPTLSQDRYGNETAAKRFHAEVLNRVRVLPGVVAAGWVNQTPLEFREVDGDFPISMEAQTDGEVLDDLRVTRRDVSDGFFAAAGLTLIQGRDFTEADTVGTEGVAVVSYSAAKRFWPGRSPVGDRIRPGGSESPLSSVTIVGVVSDARAVLDQSPPPTLYLPLRQVTHLVGDSYPRYFFDTRGATLLVRAAGAPSALIKPVQQAVLSIDAQQPVTVETLVQLVKQSLEPRLFSASLLGLFATLAITLSLIGIYGMVSYSVVRRTREMGVRIAVGADRSLIFRSVVGQAVLTGAVGASIGLFAAWVLTPLLGSYIFGIERLDISVVAAVLTLLILTAACAAYFPARRAMATDPMAVLRQD